MPRDSNGNYTLPAGNPVVTGTVISSSWANTTMPDIATALTGSLSRSGQGGMLSSFLLQDGSAAAPGLSFTTEPTTGLYRAAANTIGVAIGGTNRLTFTTTDFDLSGQRVSLAAPPVTGSTLTVASAVGNNAITINSGNTSTTTSPDIYVVRASEGTGVAEGSSIQFVNIAGSNSGLIQNSALGLQFFVFTTASGWINSMTVATSEVTIGVPTVINGSSNGLVLELESTNSNSSSPIAILQSNVGNAQVPLDFYAGGSITGRIRSDYNGNMVVAAYDGSLYFSVGGDVGPGNTAITISPDGQMVIYAPSSGATLVVEGIAGYHSTVIYDAAANGFNAGFLESPLVTFSANRTGVFSDSGKTVYPLAASLTYTIPANAGVAFPVGTIISGSNFSGGNMTIACTDTLYWAGTGATGPRTCANYGRWSAQKIATTAWQISGVNLT